MTCVIFVLCSIFLALITKRTRVMSYLENKRAHLKLWEELKQQKYVLK